MGDFYFMSLPHLNRTYKNDALSFLKLLPDESIDLVIVDPAYNSMNKWRGVGTTARMGMGKKGSGSDDRAKFFETIPDSDLPDFVYQLYRVLKNERHCYIFSDWETLKLIYQFAITELVWPARKVSGVWVEPFKPLIWDKVHNGMGYTYRCRHEYILFLWKGKKRRLNNLGIPDVLSFPRVAPSKSKVPTQKPDPLIELLVSQSSQEGEIVLDCFMGSGTTARACRNLGRQWLGCDIEQRHVDYSNELRLL